jgi:diguanylate cyclase (GGDEF)-like protein
MWITMDNNQGSERQKPLILIVDDISSNLQVLGSILSRENLLVSAATSGKQALDIADDVLPDLILLDIMMPEMDGFEVCEKLKSSEKTKDIPVIFITARTEEEEIVKGLRVGAVDYVKKPFNPPELLSRVRTHLEIKRNRDLIIRINEQLKKEIEERKKIANERKQLLKELEKKNKILKELAITDGLTGLYNHRFLIGRLSEEIAQSNRYSKNLSIIMFDIDHFKNINDTYGHQVGDEVLSKISSTIKNKLREVDIAGRFGGEEFLVILPNTSLENGYKVAEKIRESIMELKWESGKLSVTISGGVGLHKDENVTELITKADKYLYKAKENGRNRIEYKEDLK